MDNSLNRSLKDIVNYTGVLYKSGDSDETKIMKLENTIHDQAVEIERLLQKELEYNKLNEALRANYKEIFKTQEENRQKRQKLDNNNNNTKINNPKDIHTIFVETANKISQESIAYMNHLIASNSD